MVPRWTQLSKPCMTKSMHILRLCMLQRPSETEEIQQVLWNSMTLFIVDKIVYSFDQLELQQVTSYACICRMYGSVTKSEIQSDHMLQ